jgi:serpin B
MAQIGEFKQVRLSESGCSLLELPYYCGDLSMVILLPMEVDGLAEVEAALTAESLSAWLMQLDATSPHKTSVFLPRFTTRQALNLIPVLRALGMVSAFSSSADLSGMDGSKNLFLSAAMQQTFVEVNEQGTEAAAVTLFHARTMSQPGYFKADHPFLFLIRDRASGVILFLGRLVNPTLH